jgi:hypothetical protein
MAEFDIKIATDPREIVEAQRLRFQVFNLELNKGLQSSYKNGLDVDEFDPFCDHLIVRDIKSNDVVGTYRIMRGAQARQHLGFYSKGVRFIAHQRLDGELLVGPVLRAQGLSASFAALMGSDRRLCASTRASFIRCGIV